MISSEKAGGPNRYVSAIFQHPPLSEIKDLEKDIRATVAWSAGDVETLSLHEWKDAKARDSPRRGEKGYRVYDGLDDWLIERLNEHLDNDRLEKLATEALRDGSWKEIVKLGHSKLVAGEENNCMCLHYSAVFAGTERIHTMALGLSQMGKSFAQRQIGARFFPFIFYDRKVSAKYMHYLAKDLDNPGFFKGKIWMLDEFNDLPEDVQDLVKAITTSNVDGLEYGTVLDGKSITLILEGLPIIWTNTMELPEDKGNQYFNRFFKFNPDESREQLERVDEYQNRIAAEGLWLDDDEDYKLAIKICQLQADTGGLKHLVLNPIGYEIKADEKDAKRPRNQRNMLLSFVKAIAFANRHRRPTFKLKDGRKLIYATLSDNLEAIELFGENVGLQRYNLPRYLVHFMEIFNDTNGDYPIDTDEMAGRYKAAFPDEDRLESGTCYQYAKDLVDRGLLSSRPRTDDERARHGKRGYVYYRDGGSSSKSRIFNLEFENDGKNILSRRIIDSYRNTLERIENPTGEDELVREIIDCTIPEGGKAEKNQPARFSPVGEELMQNLIAELRDPKLHHDRASLKESFPSVDIHRLITEGHITEGPRGRLTWAR